LRNGALTDVAGTEVDSLLGRGGIVDGRLELIASERV